MYRADCKENSGQYTERIIFLQVTRSFGLETVALATSLLHHGAGGGGELGLSSSS
jgi:hypothetical protein